MYFSLFSCTEIDSHLDQGVDPMQPGDPKELFARLNDNHMPLMTSFTFSYIQEAKNLCEI